MLTRVLAASILIAVSAAPSSVAFAQQASRDDAGMDAPAATSTELGAEANASSDTDDVLLGRTGRRHDGFEESELDRWVPSFALSSGIVVEDGTGDVTSNVRPYADGSISFISPFVVGSLEIMSPRLVDGFARPRAFAHVDVGGLFSIEKDVAKEGAPKAFDAPTTGPINTDELISGQGSVTRADPDPFLLMAGAGVAFSWDVGEKRIRVKPSFEYMREAMTVSGLVHRGFVLVPDPPVYDFVELKASRDVVFHGFGPGLEVEADIARWSSLLVGVGASVQYYWVLSDRNVVLTDETQTQQNGTAAAQWRYFRGLHTVRAGVGMRFRWAPTD